jgi:hypothetical protein
VGQFSPGVNNFISSPAFSGKWREYNPDEFPEFTRLVVLALYYRLSVRAVELEGKPISPVAQAESPFAAAIFPGILSNIPKVLLKIADTATGKS